MIILAKLKKYILSLDIFSIVIYQLSYQLVFYLIILLQVNKNSKISFCCIVLTICLLICLLIKSSIKLLLNIKKIVK